MTDSITDLTKIAGSPLHEDATLHVGFDPMLCTAVVREILRFLFENYGPTDLKYNHDPKQSFIAIDHALDQAPHSELGKRPKITIQRGTYQTNPVGLDDSMAMARRGPQGQIDSRLYQNMVQGSMRVEIRTWNLGSCELLSAYVVAFLTWSRPYICNNLGFNEFARSLNVSPVMKDKDDGEVFCIVIDVPFTAEVKWVTKEVGIKIKGFLTELIRS